MKNIIKIFFIFLFFILLTSLNCVNNSTPFSCGNFIQNSQQKVAFFADSRVNAEIFSNEDNNNFDGYGNNTVTNDNFLSSYQNFFSNNSQNYAGNIHNLSTYLKSEIIIRAP